MAPRTLYDKLIDSHTVARLDDGTMWPTSWALTKLTPADEARITELVKQAAG